VAAPKGKQPEKPRKLDPDQLVAAKQSVEQVVGLVGSPGIVGSPD
jgi:hypothetical protein